MLTTWRRGENNPFWSVALIAISARNTPTKIYRWWQTRGMCWELGRDVVSMKPTAYELHHFYTSVGSHAFWIEPLLSGWSHSHQVFYWFPQPSVCFKWCTQLLMLLVVNNSRWQRYQRFIIYPIPSCQVTDWDWLTGKNIFKNESIPTARVINKKWNTCTHCYFLHMPNWYFNAICIYVYWFFKDKFYQM